MIKNPTKIYSGATALFGFAHVTIDGTDYTDASMAKLYLRENKAKASAVITLPADENEEGYFRFELSTTDSARLCASLPSKVHLQVGILDGEQLYFVDSTKLILPVEPSLISTHFDNRSQKEKDLDALDTTIRQMTEGRPISNYTIGGRTVAYMALKDLTEWRDRLAYEVKIERRQANGQSATDILNLDVQVNGY